MHASHGVLPRCPRLPSALSPPSLGTKCPLRRGAVAPSPSLAASPPARGVRAMPDEQSDCANSALRRTPVPDPDRPGDRGRPSSRPAATQGLRPLASCGPACRPAPPTPLFQAPGSPNIPLPVIRSAPRKRPAHGAFGASTRVAGGRFPMGRTRRDQLTPPARGVHAVPDEQSSVSESALSCLEKM